MRAVVITAPGGPEVLEWTEVPDPVSGTPAPGSVLLDVTAGAVNRADLLQRMGLYALPPGTSPYPGLEVSGRISALGPDVTGWRVGDAVCALLTGGGYAERVEVPAGQLLPVPRGVGPVDAAGLPEAAATVWSNLFMIGGLRSGESLLVHGGASGIGTMAIQVAKARGARVATTSGRPHQAGALRALGADTVINYRDDDFTGHGPYDVILDIVGGAYLDRNIRSLSDDGRLIIIGLQDGLSAELNLAELMARRAAVHATLLRPRPPEQKAAIVAETREHVWPLIESGEVRPVIDRRVPMANAAEAHRVMEHGGHLGKIVLTTDRDHASGDSTNS
jgi:putative PIG3 family NAD(P)H quinone oxidoreductase